MIDFHSHILPGIDDGAKDIKTSLDMLSESFEQGVKIVVATPHCHLMGENSVEKFLKRRKESYDKLKKAIEEDGRKFPQIVMGCELRVAKEYPETQDLKKLCIENTNYIMVEMPYEKWNAGNYDFIYGLILRGMRPIVAHMERYFNYRDDFHNLYSLDLLYQVNAESFIRSSTKRKIPKLFEEGAIHIIGSDMHDMENRPSYMKKASVKITTAYGGYRLKYLMKNAERILKNENVDTMCFGKLSIWDFLKL